MSTNVIRNISLTTIGIIALVWLYANAHVVNLAPIAPCQLPQAQHDFQLQPC